jgi:hypothetical protein
MPRADQPRRRATSAAAGVPPTREGLMGEHAAVRQRRDAAAPGSDEFRAAAEEVARIEIAIAALEEPAPKMG